MTAVQALKEYSRRRDSQAFAYLVETYNSLVYATCRRRLGSAEDVEDAVQEVFVSLACQADSIRSNVAAWLHTCAVRTSVDVIRRKAAQQRREAEYAVTRASEGEANEGEARQLLAEVDQAILELPTAEQSLVLEYFIHGRTQQQIADELKLSQPTVKRRLDRAIEQLRRQLGKHRVIVLPAVLMSVLHKDSEEAFASNALKAKLKKIGLSGMGPAKPLTAAAWSAKSIWATGAAAALAIGVTPYLWQSAESNLSEIRRVAIVVPDGDYFGQRPPGIVPEIYAPGVISIPERRDMAAVFSPAQRNAFVSMVVDGQFVMLESSRSDAQWSPLRPAGFVDGEAREPCLSPDGKRLLFVKKADIWESKLVDGRWTTAVRLPAPISTAAEEWAPSITADGTIYFATSRNEPNGRFSIWRAPLQNGRNTSATRLPAVINGEESVDTPLIAPDESFIIFGRAGGRRKADFDLYISRRKPDGSWNPAASLGAAINSPEIEFAQKLSPDGKYFFFARCSAYGPLAAADIYWVDARVLGVRSP
jgi:RNA polymerase sigma factor (sigma-70 family)